MPKNRSHWHLRVNHFKEIISDRMVLAIVYYSIFYVEITGVRYAKAIVVVHFHQGRKRVFLLIWLCGQGIKERVNSLGLFHSLCVSFLHIIVILKQWYWLLSFYLWKMNFSRLWVTKNVFSAIAFWEWLLEVICLSCLGKVSLFQHDFWPGIIIVSADLFNCFKVLFSLKIKALNFILLMSISIQNSIVDCSFSRPFGSISLT